MESPPLPWNLHLPHDEAAAADRLAEEWNGPLRPFDNYDMHQVRQMAVQSVRIDRCQHHERALRTLHAARASLRWDDDRRKAAEVLGAKLAIAPAVVLHKLMDTKQGCDWLISRWEGLGRILEAKGDWDQAQTTLALDLLGIPTELRDGPTPLDVALEARRDLVRAEVDRLHALNARAMEELDGRERDMAILGFGPDPDGQLAALRRFERSCSRRLEWARSQLRSHRSGPRPDGSGSGQGGSWSTAPAPAPARPTEEQLRQMTLARAASKKAAAPTPAVVEPDYAAMTDAERIVAAMRHPEYLALSPVDRIKTLLYGEVPAPGNRHSRRGQKARDRRRA